MTKMKSRRKTDFKIMEDAGFIYSTASVTAATLQNTIKKYSL
jgi:hypothetical protein